MAGKLQEEIKQTRPFALLSEEAALNIMRTADTLMLKATDLLKPYGLSPTQYNVLRILRGAGAAGVTCKDIGSRMITRDPDVTRLVDRLEKRRLATRGRAKEDRRFVTTRLTKAGLALTNKLDQPVQELHQKLMKRMTAQRLGQLVQLLEAVRSGF